MQSSGCFDFSGVGVAEVLVRDFVGLAGARQRLAAQQTLANNTNVVRRRPANCSRGEGSLMRAQVVSRLSGYKVTVHWLVNPHQNPVDMQVTASNSRAYYYLP